MSSAPLLFPNSPISSDSQGIQRLGESQSSKNKNFRDGFCHLLVIFITASLVFLVSWRWEQAITALFNSIFRHDIYNWVSIKILIAAVITVLAVLIIYGLHWLFNMTDHLEDHVN